MKNSAFIIGESEINTKESAETSQYPFLTYCALFASDMRLSLLLVAYYSILILKGRFSAFKH